MAQAFGKHLVRVSPLKSITERNYFVDELARCEREKAVQLSRHRRVSRMLHDAAAVRAVIDLLGGPGEEGAAEAEVAAGDALLLGDRKRQVSTGSTTTSRRSSKPANGDDEQSRRGSKALGVDAETTYRPWGRLSLVRDTPLLPQAELLPDEAECSRPGSTVPPITADPAGCAQRAET